MRVGIDFDNTIVIYDRVFHRHGVAEYGMPAEVPADKASIRAWFWSQPDGNTPWTELQGVVYGTMIGEAELAPGLPEFLRACRLRGEEVSIISHKTEYPALGPRVNLREAARGFLEQRGFFDPEGFGVSRGRLFFASTREEKVAIIASQGCAAFVDDLPAVFEEPGFPQGVTKILYDRGGREEAPPGVVVCGSWEEIARRLLPD